MKRIAQLMLEASFLKHVPRTGYQYLGNGKESVAEHVYNTTFIALIFSKLRPDVDALKLISMCLVHDLPETRIGDLNYVQKHYVRADEGKALADTLEDIPFGADLEALLAEFNAGETPEARLANDADQLSLIIDLKSLKDIGYQTPDSWLPTVRGRLKTGLGKQIADALLAEHRDDWWRKIFY